MNKIILTIIFGIILTSFASAETIYAGDCLSVNLSELKSLDNVVYDVVGNESNLEGLTINFNETTAIANICTVPNYKPDSFTLIFIDNSTKETIKEVPVGGGGSGKTKTITEYVDNYITKWRDRDVDEPIICEDEESKKEIDIVGYLILFAESFLIGLLIVVIIKTIQRNRAERRSKTNERRIRKTRKH